MASKLEKREREKMVQKESQINLIYLIYKWKIIWTK